MPHCHTTNPLLLGYRAAQIRTLFYEEITIFRYGTLSVFSVGVSSCDNEEKASIPFNGEIKMYIGNSECYPWGSILEVEGAVLIQSLVDSRITFHFDFYADLNGYSNYDYFGGRLSLTFNILGIVYDEDGNEVRREAASPRNRVIGGSNGGNSYLYEEDSYWFQVTAYNGETIRLSITSVDYEGMVTKRFKGIYVSPKAYFSETKGGEIIQSGEITFTGSVAK